MLELYEWLTNRRFVLFRRLRPADREDAINEALLWTVEFSSRLRDPGALYGACFTIALRVRAQRFREYNCEDLAARSGADSERWLFKQEQRKEAFPAIYGLPSRDRKIIRRFYFEGQTGEQLRHALQLTDTQFRLRKSHAISRAGLRARASLAG